MEENKCTKVSNWMLKAFWIFIIGSIIGYIVESIVCLVQKGYIESRQGLMYGPFTPVYGIGAVIYFLTIAKIKGNSKIFFSSMLLGGTTEYLLSFFQEYFFGTVSWDYSNLWFNINGRTSLLHCIYWGIAGLLFVKLVYPCITIGMEKIIKQHQTGLQYTTVVLLLFMMFNVGISYMAGNRQYERMNNIQANGKLDQFLDKHYPDHIMDQVYSNKIVKVSNS